MRNCFLQPIPEIEEALSYLHHAADSLLNGDNSTASKYLILADIAGITEFYKKITGKTDFDIHWQKTQPKNLLPKSKRISVRMPSTSIAISIFQRDGWRCRYCGSKVISRKARDVFTKQFPSETHWVKAQYMRHASLDSQSASLDHILPHSRGGNNAEENLVTACGPCQFGRNCWTLEEVGFNDPRERQPVVDVWDGLTRLHNLPNHKTEMSKDSNFIAMI